MIARALAVGPSVLLADEPVSMLDVSIQVDVLNLLADLVKEEGLGLLYVTHNIASARYVADSINVMYAGTIVETGPSERVTGHPSHPYTRLLLASTPRPNSRLRTLEGAPGTSSLAAESGEPPDLASPPPGCKFHPRCRYSMDICYRSEPPLKEVGAGVRSACWLDANEVAGPSADQGQPLPA
jgi:peptide/nickel transport system ATP-binding protein